MQFPFPNSLRRRLVSQTLAALLTVAFVPACSGRTGGDEDSGDSGRDSDTFDDIRSDPVSDAAFDAEDAVEDGESDAQEDPSADSDHDLGDALEIPDTEADAPDLDVGDVDDSCLICRPEAGFLCIPDRSAPDVPDEVDWDLFDAHCEAELGCATIFINYCEHYPILRWGCGQCLAGRCHTLIENGPCN